MRKHIYAIRIDSVALRLAFNDAVTREDYEAARWWTQVEVAALMYGNYNLAEACDAEEGFE
jgi:hypothetical protein